jgi:hypothetical protein
MLTAATDASNARTGDEIPVLPEIHRFAASVRRLRLCGREVDLTNFSSFEGGLVCRHCEPGQVEKREVSAATVRNLQELAAAENHCSQSSGTQDGTWAGVFTVLNYHIAHLMGREPVMGSALVSRSAQRVVE